jgi:phenylalanyl-tRNA synthetase beta chain
VRVPLSWLKEFAPFGDDWRALAATLDELGLVVEQVDVVGAGLDAVRTVRVREIEGIEGADRIRRVVVDAGDQDVQVVCGAWNFAVGDVVALAPVGTELPGGLRIGRRRLRGVVSEGMLCSPRELGIGDDHGGILVLDRTAPIGQPLAAVLGIDADVVFDVAVETNRPDALSIAGIARDLAAGLRLPWALPERSEQRPRRPAPEPGTPSIAVEVLDPDLCPRFTARALVNVRVGPSPNWVQRRLTLAGMRPINNVVDASNYVMLELGQPTHPYDLDRLVGGTLRVRAARAGEALVTLDGTKRVLGTRSVAPGDDRRDCVICDGSDQPIGIAGIMGGASTEIAPETTTVAIEAAYFDPMAVARTSKRLALRTEASARFERGCDPEGIERASDRLVTILAETVPELVDVATPVDVRGAVPGPVVVALRPSRVNAVLGTTLDRQAIADYLRPLGFGCADGGDDALQVTVPTSRPDTSREIDLIEEVARHHRYSSIPRRRFRSGQVGALTPAQRRRRLLRTVVAGLGADEAWTSSLVADTDDRSVGFVGDGIRLTNPQTPDEAVLRRSLLPGLLSAASRNLARRIEDVRLFEVGRVFPPPPPERVAEAVGHDDPSLTAVDERELLGLLLAAPSDDGPAAVQAWCHIADALEVDEIAVVQPAASAQLPDSLRGLHPGRAAELRRAGGAVVGVVGEVDRDVAAAFGIRGRRVGWLCVDVDQLVGAATGAEPSAAATPSRFPSSDVDLAFVVAPDLAASALQATLAGAAGDLLEAVVLFDAFVAADGTRSLTYRLRFAAPDRTLTDAEVGALRQACVEAAAQHGARLR